MKRASTIIFLLVGILSATYIQAQTVTGTVSDEGLIVLSGEVELLALELTSTSGSLVPLPNSISNHFDLILSNTEEKVFLGVVGAENAVNIDGSLVLNVGYLVGDDVDGFDLEGNWGGPEQGQEGLIAFSLPTPLVPEPSAGFLALSLTAVLAIRKRRLHSH